LALQVCCRQGGALEQRRERCCIRQGAGRQYKKRRKENGRKKYRKSAKKPLLTVLSFFWEVVLRSLIGLIFSNILDYFSNLHSQFQVKQQIKETKNPGPLYKWIDNAPEDDQKQTIATLEKN
jgi:hypothetical protein